MFAVSTRIAAVNVCNFPQAPKVEFDTAVGHPPAKTIAQVIQGLHGGLIQQVGDQRHSTIEEIWRGPHQIAVIEAVENLPSGGLPMWSSGAGRESKQQGAAEPASSSVSGVAFRRSWRPSQLHFDRGLGLC